MHIVKKATNATVTEKGQMTYFHDKTLGVDIPVQQHDQTVKDEAGLTGISKDGHTVTHYVNQQYFDDKSQNDPPVGEDGKPIENPIWLVMFHELGGHGYYKFERPGGNQPGSSQAGLTLDCENILRNLSHLPIRAYDAAHRDPCAVPQAPPSPPAPNQ
jgi:hypothetical protein